MVARGEGKELGVGEAEEERWFKGGEGEGVGWIDLAGPGAVDL